MTKEIIRGLKTAGFPDAQVEKRFIKNNLEGSRYSIARKLLKENPSSLNELQQKSGRPQELDSNNLQSLKQYDKENLQSSRKDLQNCEVANPNSISSQTLVNGIKELGFKQKNQQKSIAISEDSKMKRMKWENLYWVIKRRFFKVVFIVMKLLLSFKSNQKQKIWVNDESDSIPTKKQTRWLQKVMIWGAINKNGPLYISFLYGNLNQEKYLEVFWEFKSDMENKDEEFTYFHKDNARPSSCNLIQKFFNHNDITLIPSVPQSPDVNPKERIWSLLKWKLEKQLDNLEDFDEIEQEGEVIELIEQY